MMRFKTIGLSILVLIALWFQVGCILNSQGLLEVTDTIVSSPPPDGCLGEYYFYDLNSYIRVSGSMAGLTFSRTTRALPRGLSLDGSTGIISGVPAETGEFPFHIEARDTTPARNLVQQEDFTIRINRFSIITTTLPPICTGTSYNGAITVCGGTPPFTWSIADATPSPFPFRFSEVNPTAARVNALTGTPATTGDYSFAVTITDSAIPAQTVTRVFTLPVTGDLRITSPHYLPAGAVGRAYGPVSLTFCGGNVPCTWSLDTDSSLPPGLSLAANGVISGTPAVAGIYTPVIGVNDSDHHFVTQNFVFEITPTPMDTRPISIPLVECVGIVTFYIGRPGGLGEPFWQLAPGQSFPPGVLVDGDGILSGMPVIPGAFTSVFNVYDGLTGPTNPYTIPVTFTVIENPRDSGITLERVRQYTASPGDPDYDPDRINRIFLGETTLPLRVDWEFTDAAWGAAWYASPRKQARLKVIGNCSAEITSTDFVVGNRDGDPEDEYVARFTIPNVAALIDTVGGVPGSPYSFRLVLDFTEANPTDPTGVKAGRIADIPVTDIPPE